jgi:hypothetical protein
VSQLHNAYVGLTFAAKNEGAAQGKEIFPILREK